MSLNIWRETVLQNKIFRATQKQFGNCLKLGVHANSTNRNTFAELLGWRASKSGDEQTLLNASDALHVIRYWSPTAPDKIEPNLVPDNANSIIIIEDFGIGMVEYGFVGNLGIITESGTKASTEAMAVDGGFFSSFTLVSTPAASSWITLAA
mmetsp:Transcript_80589/g.231364  ORF Transcript_80589/g.231364 Transcript_80589/m.231364 type:complete len:152 (-) Transcript_80589:58-513(-)